MAAGEKHPESEEPGKGGGTPPSLVVLVAEDNAITRELSTIILQREGHLVSHAATGLEVLEQLVTRSFDLILMDIEMPDMDGFTATGLIRACEKGGLPQKTGHTALLHSLAKRIRNTHTPIIAMSSHDRPDHPDRCREAGIDGYLHKPLQIDNILKVINKIAGTDPTTAASSQSPCSGQDSFAPVDMQAIRNHLRQKFKFRDSQIDFAVSLSRNSLVEDLERSEKALVHKDFATLSLTAHKMLSTLLHLGLFSQAEISRCLENGAAEENESDCRAKLTRLAGDLRPFLQ